MVKLLHSLVPWRYLRGVCALGMGFAYALTYLLVSWCLATGVLHAPTDTAPHHHDDPHTHGHHHGADTDTAWADICDYALQVLLASAWLASPATIVVWGEGEAVPRLDDDQNRSQTPLSLSIRSPPIPTAL